MGSQEEAKRIPPKEGLGPETLGPLTAMQEARGQLNNSRHNCPKYQFFKGKKVCLPQLKRKKKALLNQPLSLTEMEPRFSSLV